MKYRNERYFFKFLAVKFAIKGFICYYLHRVSSYHLLRKILVEKKFSGRIRAYIQKIDIFIIPLFEALAQKKLSKVQQQKLLLASVLTPLFDDAIENNLLDKYLKVIDNQNVELDDAKICLFKKAYNRLISGIEHQVDFLHYLHHLVFIETNTMPPLQKLEKGSAALLLYATCAGLNFTTAEKDFIVRVGAYFQLIDDIYDEKTDRKKGIETLPVIWKNDTNKLKKLLTLQIQRIICHPAITYLPEKDTKTIVSMMHFLYYLANFQLNYNRTATNND